MPQIFVNIEVNMFNQRTEGHGEVKLMESHVPGVEVFDLECRGMTPLFGNELHHLTKLVTPTNVG